MDLNQIGVSAKRLWEDTAMRKKIIIGASAAVIAATGIIAWPSIHNAIKKSNATGLIAGAKSEYKALEKMQSEAVDLINKDKNVLNSAETQELFEKVGYSRFAKHGIEQEIKKLDSLFVIKKYDNVIDLFEDVDDKNKPKATIMTRLDQQKKDIKTVLWYCENKDKLNRTAFEQEQLLKARLSPPIESSSEIPVDVAIRFDKDYTSIPSEYLVKRGSRPVELAILFDSYYALVPRKSQLLDSLTRVMDPKLQNSLGANLAAHQDMLAHILKHSKGRGAERIRKNAQDMYNAAEASYLVVMPQNDALRLQEQNRNLVWYRPWLHAQKLSPDSIKALVKKQADVIENIERGDALLEQIEAYNAELHTQYYVFVNEHRKTPTTFRHSRLTYSYDFSSGKWKWKTEYYSTDGFKFYYTLRTQYPGRHEDETVYVGEKDEEETRSYRTWDYARNEQVGHVRAWKKMHEDNAEIMRDFRKSELGPYIERLEKICDDVKVHDFSK